MAIATVQQHVQLLSTAVGTADMQLDHLLEHIMQPAPCSPVQY
jgi:hypothetical protein